jgi:hypothetical protein
MSQVARALLLKLLAQVDRGGRDSVPIGDRSAHAYFEVTDLEERDALHAYLANAEAAGGVTLEWGRRTAAQDLRRIRIKDPDLLAAWLGVSRTAVQARTISQDWPKIWPMPRAGSGTPLPRPWPSGGWATAPFASRPPIPPPPSGCFGSPAPSRRGNRRGWICAASASVCWGIPRPSSPCWAGWADYCAAIPTGASGQWTADLFRALGLEKFPPALFIKGPLVLDYGGTDWDLTPLRPFVGLSPDAVNQIQASAPVPYLLTIENLASFQRQVREIQDAGVVLYTAGYPAPALVGCWGNWTSACRLTAPFITGVIGTLAGCASWPGWWRPVPGTRFRPTS